MKANHIVVLIGVACIAAIIAWSFLPAAKRWLEASSPLLSLLASLVALLVFVQFYQEARKQADEATKQREETERKARDDRARFNSRLTALAAEIVNNIALCNILKDPTEGFGSQIKIPGLRFQSATLEALVSDGSITHHKLRARLMTLQQQMGAMNRTIETSERIFEQSRLGTEEAKLQANQWILGWMKQLSENAIKTREYLAGTQASLEEFWANPDKFNDETYLRKKLLTEGIME